MSGDERNTAISDICGKCGAGRYQQGACLNCFDGVDGAAVASEASATATRGAAELFAVRVFDSKADAEQARLKVMHDIALIVRAAGFPAAIIALGSLHRDGEKQSMHLVMEGSGNPEYVHKAYAALAATHT